MNDLPLARFANYFEGIQSFLRICYFARTIFVESSRKLAKNGVCRHLDLGMTFGVVYIVVKQTF